LLAERSSFIFSTVSLAAAAFVVLFLGGIRGGEFLIDIHLVQNRISEVAHEVRWTRELNIANANSA